MNEGILTHKLITRYWHARTLATGIVLKVSPVPLTNCIENVDCTTELIHVQLTTVKYSEPHQQQIFPADCRL